jgi:pyruvate formate lyase activating enzyme
MKQALYYTPLQDGKVQCHLCPHNCVIAEGKAGICRQRKNASGVLYALNYGQVTSANLDPIEKKPLYHFYPGSQIMSFGTNGCNLACQFCQNWSISQVDAITKEFMPADALAITQKSKSPAIAYTYNEPFIWFEFVLEAAKLAHAKGIKNVLVTNGFVNPEPLKELLPYIDAMNIDIKSIRPEFYRKLCKAKLEPVLATCQAANETAHIEITNLVIPGENDTESHFEELAKWIAENLGQDTPLHFSAYYPTYKLDNPPTPLETLLKAYGIARKHLWFVYMGNVQMEQGSNTVCHNCQAKLISRQGYHTKILALTADGKCSNCGAENNIRL